MKYLSFLLLIIFVTGCINLKDDYPVIEFYRLNQEKQKFQNIGQITGVLQIRDFTISEEADSDQLIVLNGTTRLEKYYYHRWIAGPDDLVTDFMVERFNRMKTFSGGALRTSSVLLPDFILEGEVLDMSAHNSESDEVDANYVYMAIHINLIKRDPLKIDKTILLNKIYEGRVSRKNNEIINVAPAFSYLISDLTDQLIFDVQSMISKSKLEDKEESNTNAK
jgi:ABC-type uncharacterized transport system auxiliary subunit